MHVLFDDGRESDVLQEKNGEMFKILYNLQ